MVGGGTSTSAMIAGASVLVGLPIVVGLVTKAFQGLINETHRLTERFAPFSAAITAAQANAELRRELNDIRRAQSAGPRLAEFTTSQSKLSETLEDMNTTFMKSVLPSMTEMSENTRFIATFMKEVMEGFNRTNEGVGTIMEWLPTPGSIITWIRRAIQDERPQESNAFDFNPFEEIFAPDV